MLSSLPSGTCVRWFGPKFVLPVGACVATCFILLAGSTGLYQDTTAAAIDPTTETTSQITYCVAVLGIGFGFGFYFVGQHTFMSSTVSAKSRGLAFAVTGGTWRIGGIFFPLIAGFLGSVLGLSLAILALAVFPVLSGFLIVLCMPARVADTSTTPPPPAAPPPATATAATRNRQNCCTLAYQFRDKLFRVGTFVAFLSIVRSGREILIPLVGLHLNQDIVNISIGSTSSYICGVCMFPLSGLTMDRYGRRVSGSLSVFIFGIGLIVLGSAESYESFIAGCSIMGLGNGLSR